MSAAAGRARGGSATRMPATVLVLLPTVVVAIVVGILGMHVLTGFHAMTGGVGSSGHGHGAMSAHTPESVSNAVSATLGETGLVRQDGVQAVPAEEAKAAGAAGLAPVVTDDGGEHGMGSMMMLCSAMLLGAGAILLALFVWRRPPRLWAYLPALAGARAGWPALPVAATGPPASWRFSVIRC